MDWYATAVGIPPFAAFIGVCLVFWGVAAKHEPVVALRPRHVVFIVVGTALIVSGVVWVFWMGRVLSHSFSTTFTYRVHVAAPTIKMMIVANAAWVVVPLATLAVWRRRWRTARKSRVSEATVMVKGR